LPKIPSILMFSNETLYRSRLESAGAFREAAPSHTEQA
jgi:hypothetical protein